jgi:ABC-type multidrug transport system ATPase subunit
LFLDEPTSGLDSTASLEILSSLKDLSRLGVTVIAVIHQARYSLFRLFDGVLLLGSGGKTVYQGSSRFALKYFQNLGFKCPDMENPADFFMDVISRSVIPIGNFFFILKIFLNLGKIHLLKEFIFLKKKRRGNENY